MCDIMWGIINFNFYRNAYIINKLTNRPKIGNSISIGNPCHFPSYKGVLSYDYIQTFLYPGGTLWKILLDLDEKGYVALPPHTTVIHPSYLLFLIYTYKYHFPHFIYYKYSYIVTICNQIFT